MLKACLLGDVEGLIKTFLSCNPVFIGEYKTELLRGPKASWQGDPRFQDSSSEEEDTEETEGDNKTASVIVVE